MAQLSRTIELLPEIFRTEPNRKFLSSTLDQLSRNPEFERIQGYIGRVNTPGYQTSDNFIDELTRDRANYQLEPGVVFTNADTNQADDAITYPGMLDALANSGADISRHDRLFEADYAAWDPFIDFDKFSNFNQYYWLPAGPDSVDVSATEVPFTDDFLIDRSSGGYEIEELAGTNPVITLVRGGSYTFEINQPGNSFWIQTAPGTTGTLPESPNQSSRDVLGVNNNGADTGTITFNVPDRNAQQFFYGLETIGSVDLYTDIGYDKINNRYLDEFISEYGGIDGIVDLAGKTVVINRPANSDSWKQTTFFDNANFDTQSWDQTSPITNLSHIKGVWKITAVEGNDGRSYLTLTPKQEIPVLNKFSVAFGNQNANKTFYRDSQSQIKEVPLLSAIEDTLYYQDANNPALFGRILLVEQEERGLLDINEIVGKKSYTSPNGVEFTNGLKVQFRGLVSPETFVNQQFYVEGVGSSIKLLPVDNFVTPETYTNSDAIRFDQLPFDVGNFEESLNQPQDQDYLTINRASPDLNPWTRSNRWFHKDVIAATATYNNTTPVIDNAQKARRPILEFRSGLRLFNFGTSSQEPVDIIDFTQTDAFTNVNGSIGYSIDGVSLLSGTRIIFANDADSSVRNKIFQVSLQDPNNDGQDQIILEESEATIEIDDVVVIKSGIQSQGKSFRYDGNIWVPTQQKTATNQPPLFDVYDSNGISFGNQEQYSGSDFSGTKLFSYAMGDGPTDDVLNFPLEFLTIDNVGDIVFDNNFYVDTFTYVNNRSSETLQINSGYVREYHNNGTYSRRIGWQESVAPARQKQIFRFVYQTGRDIILDIPVLENLPVPSVMVTVDSEFVSPSLYTVDAGTETTTLTFLEEPRDSAVVEIRVISNEASRIGFYEVPSNLEKNPLNAESSSVTLGTIRNHYQTLVQNIPTLDGQINGANNSRDLGNIVPFGTDIIQHSSSMLPTGAVLRSGRIEFFKALEFNARAYEAYKTRIVDAVTKQDFGTMPAWEILDQVISQISSEKSENSAFYWSDMLPSGLDYVDSQTTVSEVTGEQFDTIYSYNFSSANRQSLIVYVNDNILIKDQDYTVSSDSPSISITKTLNVGDSVRIREYTKTNASFVPNTPTKLGLYPSYQPQKYTDTTFVSPADVIQGHDGSITLAYGDIRDDVILEFESRIYNNLKVSSEPPILKDAVVPGKFRNTEYSLETVNNILATEFLTWAGLNRLDYREQTYISDNQFTWNYSTASEIVDGETLVGHWRGIYEYFYDTDSPHTRPWEMLGLSQKPNWWEETYGPAPYTENNLILWEDIANGLVREPGNNYVNNSKIRTGLLTVLPVDAHGNLKSPLESVVANYNSGDFRKKWVFGDGAPAENAWRRSSTYPFVIQKLLALTKPAKYFAVNVDRDRYRFVQEFGQYLFDSRDRLDLTMLASYGEGNPRHSYFNWVADYNQQLGEIGQDCVANCFNNIDIKLCYRLAGFTDKRYLKLFAENFTPNTQNSSLLIPDESYQLLLYQNEPDAKIMFSSVIIQRNDDGWTVWGNSISRPYFEITESIPNGNFNSFTINDTTIRYAKDFSFSTTRVPYGYTFKSREAVVDFLVSYGRYLAENGLQFDTRKNGIVLDWTQMAKEFVYWSQQGWPSGNIINLNPSAEKISINRQTGLLEDISNDPKIFINQNRRPIKPVNYNVDRSGNLTEISVLTDDLIGYAELNFVNYEQLLILDNFSVFSDLLYDPATGNRQNRLLLSGSRTTNWVGRPDAPGFIISNANVENWEPNKKYSRGEIVRFKNQLWSASTIIEPSEDFDYSNWLPSDFDDSRQGLLPNIATKADDALDFYNKNSANLSEDADLLGLGTIGFRPRDYLENLNLDDITQTNLYSNFIGTKGTLPTTKLFAAADFGKERADYSIYENWAVKQGTYGAVGNRSYFEILLDQDSLQANPSIVSIINGGKDEFSDQQVQYNQLYKESKRFTNPNILPEKIRSRPDVSLPTAGYVNSELVDLQVFTFSELSEPSNFARINTGSTIWVSKISAFNWGVYYVVNTNAKIVQIDDNLNGQSRITFDAPHGLVAGDKIVIKTFSDLVNGFYEIETVPNLDTATIEFSFSGSQTQETGNGIVLRLESARVSQPSDVINLSYSAALTPGDRAWVDNSGSGKWEVLEKQQPFTSQTTLIPEIDTEKYGTAIAQGFSSSGVLIGAPLGGSDSTGQVLTYILNRDNSYTPSVVLSLETPETEEYGYSIAAGSFKWGVVGAPGSDSNKGYATLIFKESPADPAFQQTQLLLDSAGSSGDRFGETVAISDDEKWVYVAAPGANRVYVYARVDRQSQQVNYIGDGETTQFGFGNDIKIKSSNAGDELSVIVNNKVLSSSAGDYVVDTTNSLVNFASAPNAGSPIVFLRKEQISLTYRSIGNGTQKDFNITAIGAISASEVKVFVDNIEQTLATDYDISGQTLSFVSAPSAGSTVTAFNSNLDQLIGVDESIDSFSLLQDGALLRPGVDYTFDSGTNTIEFTNGDAEVIDKDILVRARTHFKHANTIEVAPETKSYVSHDNTRVKLNSVSGIVPQMAVSGTGFSSDQYVKSIDSDNNEVILNSPPDTLPSGNLVFSLINFGSSLDTTTDGRQVSIGCVGGDEMPGQVFVFDRIVERFQITNPNQDVYSPRRDSEILDSLVVPAKVNGRYLIPNTLNSVDQYNLNSEYSILTNANINISGTATQSGDILEIETVEFVKMQALVAEEQKPGAEFGFSVSQCPTNCSLYIGSPGDSTQAKNGGSAERFVNQPRIYGIATSENPSAELAAGDTIRINNIDVEVSSVPSHVSGATHSTGAFRQSGGDIYRAIQNVPAGIAITNTDYWIESSWSHVFAQDINDAGILNVKASVGMQGKLVISAVNPEAQTQFNKLLVLPGIGSAFEDLQIKPIQQTQTIFPPRTQASSRFGQVVQIDTEADNLVIGAPGAQLTAQSTWSNESDLTFDGGATTFIDTVEEAGTVYTYDYLSSSDPSPINEGKFVFGQQIFVNEISNNDKFGSDVDYVDGRLLVGAPDREDGNVFVFNNLERKPAWQAIDQQVSEVDSKLINSIYVYDSDNNQILRYLDWIDPLQGKILGVAKENIDFITPTDPAGYNQASNVSSANLWRERQVGKIWWDVTNYRLTEYHSSDFSYASKRWAQGVNGSQVELYQWIESSVPPSQYQGPGAPKDENSFTVVGGVLENQVIANRYYFWVSGLDSIEKSAGKTLSINAVQQYIESPRSSGIAYLAPISANTVGLFNCEELINRENSVLHVEFDQIETENKVHVEYELIPENRPDGFVTGQIYRKLLDSLCGADTEGNLVPDVTLPPSELYGIEFRPRQSMFENRQLALRNYIDQVNRVLLTQPIAETRDFSRLNSQEEIPNSVSGEWDKKLQDLAELSYQNLDIVSPGYRYLVLNDDTIDGLWAIYEVNNNKDLIRTRIQIFDTKKYWNYVDWYDSGYSSQNLIDQTAETKSDLATIAAAEDTLVRVNNNGSGLWEIYVREPNSWRRVAAESATIQFDPVIADNNLGRYGFDNEVFDAQFFDEQPVKETRQIIEAINQDLLINELGIERNSALILLFNYILSEQTTPEWLEKTSLVDVDHTVRSLEPFRVYQQDNQTFVSDYINEVKPYHVKVRQFNLKYQGSELFQGDITDFDLPAEWDATREQFVSPVLDASGQLSSTSSFGFDSEIWENQKYSEWFENRLLLIDSISVFTGGTGYSIPPQVEITGDAAVPAKARARLDVFGKVSTIEITEDGSGYTTTPTVVIRGGNGSGARAVPIMKTQGPRNGIITLRYDRHDYVSNVSDWQNNTLYAENDLVRYENEVYRVINTNDSSVLFSGNEFVLENYERVPASDLNAADRTTGYYVPAPRTTGNDLSLLIDNIEYPGVQVTAPRFNQNTGYDISAFDATPFDNIDPGPENEVLAEYTGDGSTTAYELGYPNDQLPTNIVSVAVSVDGVDQIEDTDFVLNSVPASQVATISFSVAPAADADIEISAIVTRPTYSGEILDVSYSSKFTDSFLGISPEPAYSGQPEDTRDYGIEINGGQFIDVYASHAPEELVPGSTFDTLSMTVNTRVGFDTDGDGHAWELNARNVEVQSSFLGRIYDLPKISTPITAVVVTNLASGTVLPENAYEINWIKNTVKLLSGAGTGNIIRLEVFGIGGGNQLFSGSYAGESIVEDTITVPVNFSEISEILILVNGEEYDSFNYTEHDFKTNIELNSAIENDSLVSVFVLGQTESEFGYSRPILQKFKYDGTTREFSLQSPLQFSNKSHAIVEINGTRLQPPTGVEHIADESTLTYQVTSDDTFIEPDEIGEIDVDVYINDVELDLNSDFILNPSDGSSARTITLLTEIDNGDKISIYVRTASDYVITGNQLIIRDSVDLKANDSVTIRTWGDTREQNLITKVFEGPTNVIDSVIVPYDNQPYDTDRYDEESEASEFVEEFNLGTVSTDTSRVWVTYNGNRLLPNEDFVIQQKAGEDVLIITKTTASSDDIIVITIFGQSVVPDEIKFKLFDDMRGNKSVYRVTNETTTKLTQTLAIDDTAIHVEDASVLEDPQLGQARFGTLFINGERVTYRERNLANNTLSGLRRGTAGTATLLHAAGSEAHDGTRANEIPDAYATTWYDLGDETVIAGKSLQNSQNKIARAFRNR